jgi:cell wall-associated NlpC family hydrolase
MESLHSKIADLIGKPFVPFGRGPDGYDCLGIIIEAGRRIGVHLPDYESLQPGDCLAISERLGATIRAEWVPVVGTALPGDVAVMCLQKWTVIDHVGMFLSNEEFIHCTKKLGVLLTNKDHPCWAPLIQGIYRLIRAS